MTTEEAIEKGFGVIDGGATKTLGSIHALEAIAEENLRKHQNSRVLEVDTKNTPVFGFGNSSRDKCISTAKMKIEAGDREGVLSVHALDRGKGPVLLSIATLRALKAIVDFDEDLIVFRELDDTKLIQAERSLAGHQLLPLTDNLYSKSYASDVPIPSLRPTPLLSPMPTIASLKKPELIEAIQNLGEEPPTAWGTVELRCRLAELEEAHGIIRQSGKTKTPLQQWVVKLNTATKKKCVLEEFAQQELGITNVGNSTMTQIQKAGMERIYVMSATHPSDPVGFGENAHMTYEELQEVNPGYCQWVMKMASEGSTCYRLSRLATWLENNPKTAENMVTQKKMPVAKAKSSSQKSRSRASSSSAQSEAIKETQAMMGTLVEVVKDLKNEVEALKEERPHKKKEISTDSEFSMLSDKS
eukprot:s526_g22.t1